MAAATTLALGAALAVACGGAPTRPAAAPAASASAPPAVAAPAVPAAVVELGARLARLERGPAVLDALPAPLRAELDAVLARLDDEGRRTLSAAEGPAPRSRPLLHLAAGGSAPAALHALATTSAAADELGLVRRASGQAPGAELIPAVTELARRAARHWLREADVVIASRRVTAADCAALAAPARLTGEPALARLALEAAAALEPSAARLASLTVLLAEQGDVAAAQAALDRVAAATPSAATAAPPTAAPPAAAPPTAVPTATEPPTAAPPAAAGELARARRAVERAVLAAAPGARPEEALAGARAALALGRAARAAELLAPHGTAARQHLGLAAATALAGTEGGICPGLDPQIAAAPLCAVAFRASVAARDGAALLEQAWASGAGRDDAAVEAYLGYVHVTPWTYGTLAPPSGDPRVVVAEFRQRAAALRRAAQQAATAAPRFGGLSLFTDALVEGFEASLRRRPGDRLVLPPPVMGALLTRAEGLPGVEAEHHAQSGVLGVAALASQDRDISALLDRLPARVADERRWALTSLRAWNAIARARPEQAARARAELGELLAADPAGEAPERAGLMLLVAELDAALAGPDDRAALERLIKLATNLAERAGGGELVARARLDAAGAEARLGRPERAIELLLPLATEAQGAPGEADLRWVAQVQVLVLRAMAARADERAEYRQKLVALGQAPAFAQLPASLRAWHRVWVRGLDAALAADRCGAAAPCRAAALRRIPLPARELEGLVGAESARIFRSGTLPAGALRLSFAWSGAELAAVVQVEPRLLVVTFPSELPP